MCTFSDIYKQVMWYSASSPQPHSFTAHCTGGSTCFSTINAAKCHWFYCAWARVFGQWDVSLLKEGNLWAHGCVAIITQQTRQEICPGAFSKRVGQQFRKVPGIVSVGEALKCNVASNRCKCLLLSHGLAPSKKQKQKSVVRPTAVNQTFDICNMEAPMSLSEWPSYRAMPPTAHSLNTVKTVTFLTVMNYAFITAGWEVIQDRLLKVWDERNQLSELSRSPGAFSFPSLMKVHFKQKWQRSGRGVLARSSSSNFTELWNVSSSVSLNNFFSL